MKNQYTFDKDFNLRRVTHSVRGMLWTCTKWIITTASLAAFYYILFSFFINTDEEKKLKRETKMYAQLYPEMVQKERLIADVVDELQLRDDKIYERIFHAKAPSVDPHNSMTFVFAADSIEEKNIVEYTEKKLQLLTAASDTVGTSFKSVFENMAKPAVVKPPMKSPIEGLKYAQVGSSVGQKLNPFYKVLAHHDGVDLIAGQGTPVLATADGVVTDVRKSGKGLGNVVEITHEGGYVTTFAHLEDIVVRKGEKVKAGKKLASVGMSGNSFAPHLHYEIRKDGKIEDPVNYMFGSFFPEEYMKVAYMAATTGQSMD